MPELPEVETVKRGLERTVVGKTVESVVIRNPGQFTTDRTLIDRFLVGSSIVTVDRRAKVLLLQLSSAWTLAVHLKMTGQLVVRHQATGIRQQEKALGTGFVAGHPEKAYEQPLPHKHTHVIIRFTNGTVLYFNDLRKFGWMRLLRSNSERKVQNAKRKTQLKMQNGPSVDEFLTLLNLGPEPLSDAFTLEGFRAVLKRRRVPIKTVLLDQKAIAGVGNIYADEALFAAKIRPTRKASSLTRAEVEWLYQAIPHVLQLGIEHGGTTFNAYRTVEGTSGKMRDYLKVYGREGQPCLRSSFTSEESSLRSNTSQVSPSRCSGIIQRIKLGQRSSHFCPTCQH